MGGSIEEDCEDEDYEEVSYELFLHYKQGDDFAGCLELAKDNVSKAFEIWAESFEFNAIRCRELAERFKDKEITVNSDTHHIGFYGDEELLDKLSEEDLIEKHEW